MGHMKDVSSGAPPSFRSMDPPVEVRGRHATWGFFAREEGGDERGEWRGGAGDGQGIDNTDKALQRQQKPFVHLIYNQGPRTP